MTTLNSTPRTDGFLHASRMGAANPGLDGLARAP